MTTNIKLNKNIIKIEHWLIILIFIEGFFSLFRNIDLITHARFWAEDGGVCFADAYNNYNNILNPFTQVYNGYLITYPRLIALIAQFFPLNQACNFFVVNIFFIKLIPPLILISNKFKSLLATPSKIFLITYYWFMPNSYEVFLNLTNVQWYLSLITLLIVIGNESKSKLIIALETFAITLSGLTGPFAFFLIFIIILKSVKLDFAKPKLSFNSFNEKLFLSVCILCSILQLYLVSKYLPAIHAVSYKEIYPVIVKALSGQIFVGSILGVKGVSLFYYEYCKHLIIPLVITILGLSILTYTVVTAPQPLKLFVLYTYLMLIGCFYRSFVTADLRSFISLAEPYNAIRYYFLPSLAYITSIGFIINKIKFKNISLILKMLFLIAVCCGINKDFFLPKQTYIDYPKLIDSFIKQKNYTKVKIPINPDCWDMTLIKHD